MESVITLWVLLGYTSLVAIVSLLFNRARMNVGVYRYSRGVQGKTFDKCPDSLASQLLLAVRQTHVEARQDAIVSVSSLVATLVLSVWLFAVLLNHLN